MLLLSANDQSLGLHELMPCSRPSAQPITIQSCTCVCVCVYQHKFVVSSLCPVSFRLPATLWLPSTTMKIPSQRPIKVGKPVDQWRRVPTSTVVEQIASITAVMNTISVHSLHRTMQNPLSCHVKSVCTTDNTADINSSQHQDRKRWHTRQALTACFSGWDVGLWLADFPDL